jgi:gluconolactonase
MTDPQVLAEGLQFPEGPIAMSDGSVLVVEMSRGTLSRVGTDGTVSVVADLGGGPNGAAIGPDGAVYLCNNGGYFTVSEIEGVGMIPTKAPDHAGGMIQRVDLDSGAFETLYDSCAGHRLVAPNDLVFDAHGGFWFTDHGVEDDEDRPGVLYALADGSSIAGVVYGTHGTNGVGLSPEGDRLYVAETHHGNLWAWDVVGPGQIDADSRTLLYETPDGHLFDSMAVDGEGWVCVATLVNGGITAVAPDGSAFEHHAVPDVLTTNVAFGGPDLRTAYVTASATGMLCTLDWPRRGLRLAH